jgi:hypothetical protein
MGRYWAALDRARARIIGDSIVRDSIVGGGGKSPQTGAAAAPGGSGGFGGFGGFGVGGGDVGVVVHSLRAVGVASLKALAQGAFDRGLVLHVHLEVRAGREGRGFEVSGKGVEKAERVEGREGWLARAFCVGTNWCASLSPSSRPRDQPLTCVPGGSLFSRLLLFTRSSRRRSTTALRRTA